MKSLLDDYIYYDLFNQKEINIVLNDVRIKLVLLEQFKYVTSGLFDSPILIKNNILVFSYYRYASIMLNPFGYLPCFKLCWHN